MHNATFGIVAMVVMSLGITAVCALTSSALVVAILAVALAVPVVLHFGGKLSVTRRSIQVGRGHDGDTDH